jgi:predicted ATP-dependent endonuclease of OLD family
MVHINSIDIQGYKGIESISIDPKQINIITGRNNTGKTSILEGIEFGLSPKYARNYENNISDIINFNCEKAEVKLKTNDEHKNSKLREPDIDDKSVIYKKQIINAIKKHGLVSTDEDLIDEDILDILEDIIAEHLDSLDKAEYKSVMENVLIIEHNGNEYPILYAENTFYSDLIEGNEENIKKIFKDKNESVIEQNDIEFEEIYSTFEEVLKIVLSEKNILMRKFPYNPHKTMITQHTSLDDDLKPKHGLNNDVKKVRYDYRFF